MQNFKETIGVTFWRARVPRRCLVVGHRQGGHTQPRTLGISSGARVG